MADLPTDLKSLTTADGAHFELMLVRPEGPVSRLLCWLPAMGVPARHYLPLAQALADRGIATAIHEWRGIGSSGHRAGRRQSWGYRELLEYDLVATVQAARDWLPEPRLILGGHSLGGQLATLYAALHPDVVDAMVLVASGAPYWRRFRHGHLLRLGYAAAPWLARLRGHLPGRALGFAGNEARGVIADWSYSGRSGRYVAKHLDRDLELSLARLSKPVLALRLRDDWMAPQASLDWLLGKLQPAPLRSRVLGPDALAGATADHFAWMRSPVAVAGEIARWSDGGNSPFGDPHRAGP